MRVLKWLLGGLMVVAVVVFGLQIIASETGEVVVLYTSAGDEQAGTRLWVVDHDGVQWLRSGGGSGSGWYSRLLAAPRVELERGGLRRSYVASPEPAMAARINELMLAKYGWRDEIVAVLAGSRDNAVAIRLTPAD